MCKQFGRHLPLHSTAKRRQEMSSLLDLLRLNMQETNVCHSRAHHVVFLVAHAFRRVQLKRDGTQWRTGVGGRGGVKGKLANGVGSQYPLHYHGTWCTQHYYRWCPHLGCQQSTELTPPPIWMVSSISPKDEIWFLRVCRRISTGL